MKRVDATDFQAIRGAGPLFDSTGADGPFAKSLVEPDEVERLVAGIIWPHRGRSNPISIAMLSGATGRGERTIKGIVEQLVVTHRIPIGGRRAEPVGYFVIVDAEDLAAAVQPYREQIFAMWRRLRVLLEPRALAELHGQLVIDKSDAPHDEQSL